MHLRPVLQLEEAGWVVKGDFLAHEYEATSGSEIVMSMSKKWLAWGDTYVIDIPDPKNERLALCVALAIDCMCADMLM